MLGRPLEVSDKNCSSLLNVKNQFFSYFWEWLIGPRVLGFLEPIARDHQYFSAYVWSCAIL